MSESNANPPICGTIIQSFCECAKKETAWSITRYSKGGGSGYAHYIYSWTCLNCKKSTIIGDWSLKT